MFSKIIKERKVKENTKLYKKGKINCPFIIVNTTCYARGQGFTERKKHLMI